MDGVVELGFLVVCLVNWSNALCDRYMEIVSRGECEMVHSRPDPAYRGTGGYGFMVVLAE